MKNLWFVLIAALLLVGCTEQEEVSELQNLVEKSVIEREWKPLKIEKNSSAGYRTIKEIDDEDHLKVIAGILETADWQEEEVQMEFPPDYRFANFQSRFYGFWVTKDNYLEVISEGEAKYAKLGKEESETLLQIMQLEISPIFSIPVLFGDGKEGQHVLIGEKGKLGFLIASGANDETIEIEPFQTNKPDKYMWYLWGENLKNKPFKVMGINIDTEQNVVFVEEITLGSELNGSDAHIPSNMEFPSDGTWKLEAYVDDQLFGTIMINVTN
jgi:hypothetical protein